MSGFVFKPKTSVPANGVFYYWVFPVATVPNPGIPVIIEGAADISSIFNAGFDLPGDNTVVYQGSSPALFKVTAMLSGDVGALLTDYTLFVAVNNSVVTESAITVQSNAVTGKLVIATQAVVLLNPLDEVSLYLDANSSNPFTVTSGNVLITQINS